MIVDLRGKCFKCSSCGPAYDESPAVGACQICEEIGCLDCMSREGDCVPCGELRRR